MALLKKETLALTFKFDCDRFLRFRLASDDDRDALGISNETYKRPGIDLIKAAGRRWEADKYQDLIDTSGKGKVTFLLDNKIDDLVERKLFKKIQNLFDILRQPEPPQAIIEAEFTVPTNITPGLQKAYDDFGLEQVRVRPDILWIRPGGTGAPLIGNDAPPEYEIHIIDVKMAAEPSLRHFTEVTYYALALATAIKQEGLSDRYAVSAKGTIWPGSHDMNAFRNKVNEHQAKGSADPVSEALSETLIPVPYEVYEVHVKQFFEDRLLRVLQTDMEDANWHVSPKCQLCDYVRYCREKASECDHLSRLAWLNQGQAELLRSNGITTTAELTEAVTTVDHRWQSVIDSSHQLRADGPALATRARSLIEGVPLPVEGRRSTMMPAWTNQSIFITIHFDPGSGISFALGAARLYFPHGRNPGDPPVTDERIFRVDRVNVMNPETERERLKEFATVISEWLEEVASTNEEIRKENTKIRAANKNLPIAKKKPLIPELTSHIFFWDMLEVRQLKRMFERHMQNPDVVELIEVLTRFFPPDNLLPDPDAFKSQPGTIVKEVLRMLVGLPVVHDYSLFDAANSFFPNIVSTDFSDKSLYIVNEGQLYRLVAGGNNQRVDTKEGYTIRHGQLFYINDIGQHVEETDYRLYKFKLPFGFETPMSDQIPFERAYELWQDKIFVRHFNKNEPDPSRWRRYTRDELYKGIEQAIKVHLKALQHIVRRLRENYKDRLTLKKGSFSAARSPQASVPGPARSLIAFEKLNVTCQEMENRNTRSLPVDEREAKFFSIRGLTLKPQPEADPIIDEIKFANPQYQNSTLYVFDFSPNSRDSRIKEGEFTVALSNESENGDLDEPWRHRLGLAFYDAEALLAQHGLNDSWMVHKSVGALLEVTVIRLEAMQDNPYVVLKPGHQGLFQFAVAQGLVALDSPLVLDPMYRDFSSDRIEKALRAVGGKAAPIKRARKRR